MRHAQGTSRTQRGIRRGIRRGITIIELMVVVGIIALLISLLVVAVSRAIAAAEVSNAKSMMSRLGTALQTYKIDHKDFPPSAVPSGSTGTLFGMSLSSFTTWDGSQMLCQAMLGPQDDSNDNQDGPGWKIDEVGRTYGPYYDPSQGELSGDPLYFTDPWGGPIMYFRATADDSPLFGNNGRFDAGHHDRSDELNVDDIEDTVLRSAQYMLGSNGGDTSGDLSIIILGP